MLQDREDVVNGGPTSPCTTRRHSTQETGQLPGFTLRFKVVRTNRGSITFVAPPPLPWLGTEGLSKGWDGVCLEAKGRYDRPGPMGQPAMSPWLPEIARARGVVLGSTFWRGDRGRQRLVFERPFTDLGVTRTRTRPTTTSGRAQSDHQERPPRSGSCLQFDRLRDQEPCCVRVSRSPRPVWDMVAHEPVLSRRDRRLGQDEGRRAGRSGRARLRRQACGSVGGLHSGGRRKVKYWNEFPRDRTRIPASRSQAAGPS